MSDKETETVATKPAEAADESAPPKKGKKKLILIVVLVLLLAGGGGGAWFFMNKKKPDAETTEAEEEAKAKAKKKSEFMQMEPWFTVNLRDEHAERYLQLGLVFELSNPKTGERMKEMMPVVRSKVLLLLSAKASKDVDTPDGKEDLAEEIITAVKTALADPPAAKGIENVHFSTFVIQ